MSHIKIPCFRSLLLIALVLACVSCGKTYDKYAVVLWAEQDDQFVNGDLAGVIAFSSIRKEYQIQNPGVENAPIKPMEAWRLKVFDSRGQAEEYLRNNKDFLGAFGNSLKQALPVRAKADRTSAIVYRLKENEEVKILGREKEKRDEAGLVDYWYEIMTREGTSGWVFGYQLRTADEVAGNPDQDPLAVLANSNWRPVEFQTMVANGTIDLVEFKPEYGFFLYPEEKKVVLSLSKDQVAVSNAELKSRGKNSWQVGDSGMQLNLDRNGELRVEWLRKDKSLASRTFVNFKDNVQALYDAEKDRRTNLILELSRQARSLSSENFGALSLRSDGSFVWEGFGVLSPAVIPANARGTGKAEIRYYLGNALAARHTGIISLDFDLSSGNVEEVNFLYQIGKDGIRLEHVRKSQFKGLRLLENQSNPQIIFFNY